MNNYYHKIISIFMLALCTTSGNAADLAAGKAKSATCQGCHGTAGISSSPLWPSLAGQRQVYLESQLNKFRTGLRVNEVMRPMVASLSEADMQNLAAYFASLNGKWAGGGDANLVKSGKDKVGMCLGCHGNNAQGMGTVPKLAGQQSHYLAKQLTDFKNGARKAAPMNALAQSLSDDDIKALAAYLGSL